MKLSITELVIANFEQQLELQKLLQAESLKLRTCILQRKMNEIAGITHTIDEIAGNMDQLENERITMLAESELGPDAARSFDYLVRSVPEASKDRLNKVRTELKNAIKNTARMNISNRILLEEALLSVKNTVSILTRASRASTGYDFNGKTSTVNRKKLLNRIG